MHTLQSGSGYDNVALVVGHFVDETKALLFEFKERGSNRDDISSVQFLDVGDVLIDRSHSALCRSEKARRQAKHVEKLPSGLIELADVPHDVHVADMIAVPRIDSAAIGDG